MITKKTATNAKRLAALSTALLSNCYEKEERLAKKYGLTQTEYRSIRYIYEKPDIKNKEMAQKMSLSASRLTRIIDGLVEKDYVIREILPADRRSMRIYFSDKGNELIKKMNLAYLKVHEEILSNIDPELHEKLLIAMQSLLDTLEKWLSDKNN